MLSCRSTRPTRPRAAKLTPCTRARSAGLEVFYDDRDERPGSEVQGRGPHRLSDPGQRRWPRLKEGKVEVISRRDKSVRPVGKDEAVDAVRQLLGPALSENPE